MNDTSWKDHIASSANSRLVAGDFRYFNVLLNNDVEKICIVAYHGESIPNPEYRSVSNYYRWEYDNGFWKDVSGHDLEYIDPSQCFKKNNTYSFYIGIDNKAKQGHWTVLINIDDDEEVESTMSIVVVAQFNFFIFSLIGVYEPDLRDKRAIINIDFICSDQKRIMVDSKINIEKRVDEILKKRTTFDQEEKSSKGTIDLYISSKAPPLNDEVVKSTVSTYPRSRLKNVQSKSVGSLIFNKKVGGGNVFRSTKLDSYRKIFTLMLTIILLSIAFVPIITPQDTTSSIDPTISSFSVFPEMINSDGSILLNASVSDPVGVTYVIADIAGLDTINLSFVEGNIVNNTIYSGLWQENWFVNNVDPGNYTITLKVMNRNNMSTSKKSIFTVLSNTDVNTSNNNTTNVNLLNETFTINNGNNSFFDNPTLPSNENISNTSINDTVYFVDDSENIKTTQFDCEINQPVRWMKEIRFENKQNDTKEFVQDISIPSYAEDITVIDENGAFINDGVKVNHTDLSLSEYKLEKKFSLNEVNKKSIDLDSTILIEINETMNPNEIKAFFVNYSTPGPTLTETTISSIQKRVTISSDIHYTNISAYADIDNIPRSAIHLYHIVNDMRIEIDFTSIDTNSDNLIDRIEWIVPHLSEQVYEIVIEITKAEHLDENRQFISDIYDYVKTKDNKWSEPINEGEYVRATFERPLTSKNDITIYVRNKQGLNTFVEVYYVNSSEKITEFPVITTEKYYTVYLTDMEGSHSTFDLKIVNNDLDSVYLEFDHIVDPNPPSLNGITTGGGETTSLSFSHTTPSNENRLLVVEIGLDDNDALKDVNTVEYGTYSLTQLTEETFGGGGPRIEVWYLVNPPIGDNTVYINISGGNSNMIGAAAISLSDVNQTTPIDTGTVQTDTGNERNPSVTVSSESGDLVMDIESSTASSPSTNGSGQTKRWDQELGGLGISGHYAQGSTASGDTSVTMTWDRGSNKKGTLIGFNINGVKPTVITNESIGVEETNATLCGWLQDNGSDDTTCYFLWGTQNPPTDNNVSQNIIADKVEFSYDTSSSGALTKGTLYYFDTKANNSRGWDESGGVRTFLTKSDQPTSLTAQTNSTSVIYLTWANGAGANNTYIERNASGVTVWAWGTGTVVYNDTGTYYEDTGLAEGVTYYYQAWSYANWTYDSTTLYQWSDNNASVNNITHDRPSIDLVNPSPNGTTGVSILPMCQIWANDSDSSTLDVYWFENSSGSYLLRNINSSISVNSIVNYTFTEFSNYSTTYWWKVAVNDSTYNTTEWYYFTTKLINTSVDTITPYILTYLPYNINVTGYSDLDKITLWYQYSTDNSSWSGWMENITDTSPPWKWSFNFSNGTGYYEFYSLGNKSDSPNETAPGSADAICYFYHSIPVINTYDLRNITGSKLNNATGLLDVNNEYIFQINVTDLNGWENVELVNITAWYDNGSDATIYNQSDNLGGNLNMKLQYENTSGTPIFRMLWPDNEAELILGNCTESIINETTRVLNISFKPLSQVRWAGGDGEWDTTQNTTNDQYSWNFNITVVDTTDLNSWKTDEYGIYCYTSISPAENWVDVIASPGFNDSSNVVTITYSSNYDFNMTIYFEENLTNITWGTNIPVANNVDILANADLNDDITTDITFLGIGEVNAVDIFNNSGVFQNNNVSQTVDVQFDVYIPLATMGGIYTSRVAIKILHD
jgi:hypothetical protein